MSAQAEKWRVSTIEGVFEADLETLKQWILEGCVHPTDKVSKGNLNWIEAGRAPMLRAAFNGEATVVVPATVSAVAPEVSLPSASPMTELKVVPAAPASAESFNVSAGIQSQNFSRENSADVCHNHPQIPTHYVCRGCSSSFCDECPRFVANSKIPLCPLCGDLCKAFAAIKDKVNQREFQSAGFGFQDFLRAISYPLQHKVALAFGAGLYGFLLLGGFRGRIVASVLMFGCVSQVISEVAWGRLHKSFMPDFSEFSLYDDLVVPISLGIGITIVTWGPAIVLVLALLFGVISGPSLSPSGALQAQGKQSEEPLDQEALATLVDPNADPKKVEEASKKLEQLHPGYQMRKEAERSKEQLSDPLAGVRLFLSYFHLPIFLVLLLLLSIAWGVFYYPMALAVAGYTQSFGSVVNPLVGIDTIRRMGSTYFKAFGMVLVVQVVGFVVGVIVALITAPFALPFFGNLPAMFIDGSLTFYFNLVVACVLGLSLYKRADELGINID